MVIGAVALPINQEADGDSNKTHRRSPQDATGLYCCSENGILLLLLLVCEDKR